MAVGKTIKVLGIDPALRNFGFCVATVDVENDCIVSIDNLYLSKTEDERGKTVRRNSDDLRRAKEHVKTLKQLSEGVTVAFAEVPVGSQSARAMASYGVCIGVLASCPIGLFEVTPSEVKQRTVGVKTATKDEMIEWATERFPSAPWLRHNGRIKKDNEHLADATAAIVAGLQTKQWQQAKIFLTIN